MNQRIALKENLVLVDDDLKGDHIQTDLLNSTHLYFSGVLPGRVDWIIQESQSRS